MFILLNKCRSEQELSEWFCDNSVLQLFIQWYILLDSQNFNTDSFENVATILVAISQKGAIRRTSVDIQATAEKKAIWKISSRLTTNYSTCLENFT